jgi:uncharacterized protein with NRDE domain
MNFINVKRLLHSDLEARGTWMAMNKNGRIAMVTNYRDLKNLKNGAPSRGALVTDFLTGNDSPQHYLQTLTAKGHTYNGYNLIVGSPEELWYKSNYREGTSRISTGLHGLSNHLLDTPWPKVTRGLDTMKATLANQSVEPNALFKILMNDQLAEDHQLPDTGVGLERERMLSAMFIKSPGYGTRCSTVVMIDKYDQVYFAERVYDLQTFSFTQNTFEFSVER